MEQKKEKKTCSKKLPVDLKKTSTINNSKTNLNFSNNNNKKIHHPVICKWEKKNIYHSKIFFGEICFFHFRNIIFFCE